MSMTKGGFTIAGATTYRKLNMSKLRDRKRSTISSKNALKDVIPIEWSNDVKAEKKKVEIK